MKHLLSQLAEDKPLSTDQAVEAFELIMSGESTPAQTAALLTFLQSRGPTTDEIVGAATVMRAKVAAVNVPAGLTVIDTCGTGGTGSKFFNISTAAAIVVAAAGRSRNVVVAKHGNKSVTSASGSAQVLETLGVKLKVAGETLSHCLEEAGLCFCFAPSHHPAMKHAAPVRAELGFRTIFNVLGPLTNPAGAKRQLVGIYAPDLTGLIADVLLRLGADGAMVVHSQLPDGGNSGEIATWGTTRVSHLHDGTIEDYLIDPSDYDLPFAVPDSMYVDSSQASADVIRSVLAGTTGPARDVVCLNAAAGLVIAEVARDLAVGLELAGQAIDSGGAKQVLEKLIAITQADPT